MFKWLGIIVRTLRSALRPQRELALENLVLRQQLAVLKHRYRRPRLTDADRLFWVLSRIWSGWRESLHIIQPETVVRWHRQVSGCVSQEFVQLDSSRPGATFDKCEDSRKLQAGDSWMSQEATIDPPRGLNTRSRHPYPKKSQRPALPVAQRQIDFPNPRVEIVQLAFMLLIAS